MARQKKKQKLEPQRNKKKTEEKIPRSSKKTDLHWEVRPLASENCTGRASDWWVSQGFLVGFGCLELLGKRFLVKWFLAKWFCGEVVYFFSGFSLPVMSVKCWNRLESRTVLQMHLGCEMVLFENSEFFGIFTTRNDPLRAHQHLKGRTICLHVHPFKPQKITTTSCSEEKYLHEATKFTLQE